MSSNGTPHMLLVTFSLLFQSNSLFAYFKFSVISEQGIAT